MPRNIEDLCRLCLHNISRHGSQIAIFGTVDDEQQTLSSKIAACLQLTISINDSLPKHICKACYYKVDCLYKFKTTCIKSETYFNEQIHGYKICDVKIEFCDSDTAFLSSDSVGALELYNALAQVCQTERSIFPMEFETSSSLNLESDVQKCINNISTVKPDSSDNQILEITQKNSMKINDSHLVPDWKVKPIIIPSCDENLQDTMSLSEKDLIKEECHANDKKFIVDAYSHEIEQHAVNPQSPKHDSELECSILPQSTNNQCKEDILQENKNSTLTCSFCSFVCQNAADVQAHIIEKHNIEKNRNNSSMFQELQNSRTFNLNSSLLNIECESVPEKKDIKELVSCECGETFSNMKDLKKHITQHHLQCNTSDVNKLAFICKMCGEKFKTQFLRDYHFSQHFEDLKCKHCSYVSKHRNIIESHERHCYKQNWPFKCPVCEEKFLIMDEMWSHKEIIHTNIEVNPVTCNVCNKKFKNIKDCDIHNTIHTTVENEAEDGNYDSKFGKDLNQVFICDFCQQNFNAKSSIEYHMMVHLAEREKLSIFIRQLSSDSA